MHVQNCPVCTQLVDVSIFVTGQKARCGRCGNKFLVSRSGDNKGARAAPVEEKKKAGPDTRPGRRAVPAEAPAAPAPAEPAAAPAAAAVQAAPADPDAPPPSPLIPGYTIMRMLGQGAMGSVWKAAEVSTGELVAIKVLVEHLARHQDFIYRFEREAKALAVVKHPGVVALRDRGSHGGLHYLVMEYVDGEPIRREMERTRMPANRAVAICRRVARGLEAAHRAGVVHRDLKPENVLLSRQGELKIVDFGLAGLVEEVNPHPNLTRSRVTMGTVNYMAPEQRTDAKRVDKRADVYSLGVMLYEMFTRDLPLGRFQMPAERGFPVPPFVDEVLRKALATNAADRHQTAMQLDADLAEIEKHLQSPAPDDVSGKRRWWPFA